MEQLEADGHTFVVPVTTEGCGGGLPASLGEGGVTQGDASSLPPFLAHKCLVSIYYMPGVFVGTGNIVINKTSLCPHGPVCSTPPTALKCHPNNQGYIRVKRKNRPGQDSNRRVSLVPEGAW